MHVRPVLPISVAKCYSHECDIRNKCARYLVEPTPGRKAACFYMPGGGCLNAIPMGSVGVDDTIKQPHEAIKGIC